MTIHRNKYDERESEARKLDKIANGRWNQWITLKKPVWDGSYIGKWVMNEKHSTHPRFEVAQSILHLLTPVHCWGKSLPEKRFIPDQTISEKVYEDLDPQQKKFFHWSKSGFYRHETLRWSRLHEGARDFLGNKIYELNSWERGYFFEIKVVRHKTKHIRITAPQPEVEKVADFLYNTGFARKYLWKEHHSDRYESYESKGLKRKTQREIQELINRAFEELN